MPALPDLAIERLRHVEGLGRIYDVRGSLPPLNQQRILLLVSPAQSFDVDDTPFHQKLTSQAAASMADLISLNTVTRVERIKPRFRQDGSLVLGRISFDEQTESSAQTSEVTGTALDEAERLLWLNSRGNTVKISRTLPEGTSRRYSRSTDIVVYNDPEIAWLVASYQERAWQGSMPYNKSLAAMTEEIPAKIARYLILEQFPFPRLREELQRTHPYPPITG